MVKLVFYISENYIKDLKEKKQQLEAIVASQQISPEEKQKIQSQIATLQSEIQSLNDEHHVYQEEVYKVDLKLVGLRNAVCLGLFLTEFLYLKQKIFEKFFRIIFRLHFCIRNENLD